MFDSEPLNILYGVQATGNGHITRSREIILALKNRGHRVQTIVSGRAREDLWDMQAFEPFDVFEGLSFKTGHGRIKIMDTLLNARPLQMRKDIKDYEAEEIDLVIVDYEPISARIAKRHNLPSIGIGHQYAFRHAIPQTSFNPVTRAFMEKFAPVDLGIGLHWHHFDSPILPPIIPRLIPGDGVREKMILVYLPFEDDTRLIPILQKVDKLKFVLYTNSHAYGPFRNVFVKPLSRTTFREDLLVAEGVLCNSGFELPSEALALRKKLMVKPLKGQPEQVSNALALEKMSLGMTTKEITPEAILNWYHSTQQDQIIFPNVVPDLVDWIEWGQWDNASLNLLAKELWSRAKSIHSTAEHSSEYKKNYTAARVEASSPLSFNLST
ncbi:MAG: glycosyltransferase [Candidatus Marinimicrobia bacterium]|nr:glycosyltransferase [Candidatus Neomarinimicrobiota bacterium]